MGRSVSHWVCVCALRVVRLIVCGEIARNGGTGGDGGSGGTSGTVPRFDPLEGIGTVELVADGFEFAEGRPGARRSSGFCFRTLMPTRSMR